MRRFKGRLGAGSVRIMLMSAVMVVPAAVLGCASDDGTPDPGLASCISWREGEPCQGEGTCFGDGICRSVRIQCVDHVVVFQWSGVCATCSDVELLPLEEVETYPRNCEPFPGSTCTHADPEGDGTRVLMCNSAGRFALPPE